MPNAKQAADAALERVGLTRVKDGLAREFSRGMRQRLAIARAFLHNPELLLLDEPFTSLDDRAIAVLQTLLADARARGATIVMSTHQIREAMELASDVALLERGRMIFAGAAPSKCCSTPAGSTAPTPKHLRSPEREAGIHGGPRHRRKGSAHGVAHAGIDQRQPSRSRS